MDLQNTVSMMNSSDFKERFRAEYFQLKNRIDGLNNMLDKYRKNELTFKPKCNIKILDGQLNSMKSYMTHLVERAKIEGISLEESIINKPSINIDENSVTVNEGVINIIQSEDVVDEK